jgi:hypothetical protein
LQIIENKIIRPEPVFAPILHLWPTSIFAVVDVGDLRVGPLISIRRAVGRRA